MALRATDVESVIARPKLLVAPMSWAPKLGREDAVWVEFALALAFADLPGVAAEGLLVRGQWRPPAPSIPGRWSFGFHLASERVYAIDVLPLGRHKNCRGGVGRPLHGAVIEGNHEHTWSADGGGYAEPLDLPQLQGVESTWLLFAERAGILNAGFVHPDPATAAGQADMFL